MTLNCGTGRTLGRVATLTIGQLAHEAGVNVETIRFYERRGLLRKPPRTPAGYLAGNGAAFVGKTHRALKGPG